MLVENNEHNIFISSDSDEIQQATNGIDIFNNKSKIHHMLNLKTNSSSSEPENNNGWDDNANSTINNWYNLFKQQSFIYQWVLERNKKISDKLIIAAIISSSVLGIFSGFKLWIKDDSFTITSDLIIMLSNFSIAFITGYSKSYIDDNRNELIRIYIDEVDELLGEISAQVLSSPIYRSSAHQFFKDHNYKYTKLITYIPNISLYELNESKKKYEEFKKHVNLIT